jgi:hypothetical protein
VSAARTLTALLSGILFTVGLNLSGMTQPLKILGFLDVTGAYTGAWDPSLIVVMCAALAVHAALRLAIRRRKAPLFDARFVEPTRTGIDRPLVIGSIVWGVGWGLTGLCPGPVLAAVGDGNGPVLVFFAAMLAGMAAHHGLARRGAGAETDPASGAAE